MNNKVIVLTAALIAFLSSSIFAGINYENNRLSLGLFYSGISVKYGFAKKVGLQFSYQGMEQNTAVGSRVYFYLTPASKFVWFLGGEADRITLAAGTDGKSLGNGLFFGAFAGLEYYFLPNLSLITDLTAGQLTLQSSQIGIEKVSIQNINEHVIANLGMNLYFGKPYAFEDKVTAKKYESAINIAVSEFAGRNVSDMDSAMVSDFVREIISQDKRYVLVERGNMQKILAEQQFQSTGCTSSECAVKIGRLLNVKKIVIGSLGKLENVYHIQLSVVDVETGEQVNEGIKAYSADELDGKTKELANRIANLVWK
ncbi:MAG: CsgG/HfaB family protein [Elusimicrobiota bacterium]